MWRDRHGMGGEWQMKRTIWFVSIALGAGLVGHALGADLPVRAPPAVTEPVAPTWTGLYVGFNGGWGWTNSNTGNGTLSLNDTVGGALFAPVTIASANHNAQSPLFGGQVGYNLQAGSWVFGVEGDVDGADITASQAIVFPASSLLGAGGNGFLTQKQEWLASVRGRIGYTVDRGMIYFTAGEAWTNVKIGAGATILGTGAPGDVASPVSINTTRSGYVIGGGYERMIDANWLVRAEYLYYGFTGVVSGSNSFPVLPAIVTANAPKFNTSVARIGISYKLDWGAH
jgi:outer membrane immunogenic protein